MLHLLIKAVDELHLKGIKALQHAMRQNNGLLQHST